MEDIAEAYAVKKGSRNQANGMSQTIDLFRKYLLSKSQNQNVGKTNEEESEALKERLPPRALIPIMPNEFESDNFSRPPSLLERKLFPELRCEEVQTSSTGTVQSPKAQLTIFYDGVVNVYDNVPTDKAQALMLLAGQSSLSNSNEKPKTQAKTPHLPNLDSSSKLQADLPIARKISLQHFLAKRRSRIVSHSPYALTGYRDKEMVDANFLKLENRRSKENNQSISLLPFCSSLGYLHQ